MTMTTMYLGLVVAMLLPVIVRALLTATPKANGRTYKASFADDSVYARTSVSKKVSW